MSEICKIHVVDDPRFDEHAPRGYHPERPERLGAARRGVERARAGGATLLPVAARDATEVELLAAHSAEYIEDLTALDGKAGAVDPDTYVSPRSVRAAYAAAGGAAALVEAIWSGETRRGVALLRPPGHHATREQAMGFCLLNNAAVAAGRALALGAKRVAIVDWDVHHGNGTEDIFWSDPRVLYVSLHQWPLYPGTGAVDKTGAGDGSGFTVNVPLSEGGTPAVYADAFRRVVAPVVEEFAPEFVLISAGFDAHARDPLAAMSLDDDAYGAMASDLAAVADRTAQGRVALLLEGGYDLSAIEGSLAASIDGLFRRRPHAGGPVGASHAAEVAEAERVTKARWRI